MAHAKTRTIGGKVYRAFDKAKSKSAATKKANAKAKLGFDAKVYKSGDNFIIYIHKL